MSTAFHRCDRDCRQGENCQGGCCIDYDETTQLVGATYWALKLTCCTPDKKQLTGEYNLESQHLTTFALRILAQFLCVCCATTAIHDGMPDLLWQSLLGRLLPCAVPVWRASLTD